MLRPTAISLSPNVQKEDVLTALKMFFKPRCVIKGKYINLLEEWFKNFYHVSHSISFISGRGALYATLKSLNVIQGDEVIMQAFTCVAVCDPIISLGAKPVYCDITQSLTIEPLDIERKITNKTKVIIVQHTFGIPANMRAIIEIAKKHKIAVIEDCAHIIGAEYENKKLGLFGDAAIFSFGRDKAFSSVFGGMVLTDNDVLGKKIEVFQEKLNYPSFLWSLQQLFHPVALSVVLPLYNFLSLGKLLLVFLQSIHFLSFPVSKEEKEGFLPISYVKKLPNSLALLVLLQLKKMKVYNKKRQEFARLYLKSFHSYELPYKKPISFLRFPVLIENRDKVLKNLTREGIYLGKWYSEIIDPKGVNFDKIYYTKGMCPNAEKIAEKIINLPTYPIMSNKEAERVVKVFKKYV
ncbi:MAG: DegT/DnrJ/EryC1/StrS family aminotransferase [bacterium]|nr:DegT/DnrJ/EryC1/StrS family aminotransferase [bacterium]